MRSLLPALLFPVLLALPADSPPARDGGFSPAEALARMQVPDGFRARLVAAEPAIRQPVTMTFDDRGRLWVIQYLQYPNPAGLKPVQVDQYLRTVYDHTPEPPPQGPRGADRITILDDPDGTGNYRKAKDFLGGLNLASGMALGHGGVYVVQPPYLLFYPDRNGDDVPDGDPEVLLSGFGLEDAHALANSLQWGPDGWLYGAQGSTVTAKIRNPQSAIRNEVVEFQQGIWRFHPITHEFELFAEGGGNTWGLDFDRHGNAIAGTNFGGVACLHQVQGGYYVKGFAKHGPLHNPHTYGYFDHIPYTGFRGGHVTCGGILYQGGAFPERYRDQYIAGNLLSNCLDWHRLERQGSSFTARRGGDFLVAHDTWFRPVDCLTGPDGALYVADWYDKRANHVDPRDTWDRSNGRIYKVEWQSSVEHSPWGSWPGPADALRDLAARPLDRRSNTELVALLAHPNSWYRGEARRLLGERHDTAVLPALRRLIDQEQGELALEALWALYVSGGFDETLAVTLLVHPNEDVRTWTIRFLGDTRKVSARMRDRLIGVARKDGSPTVRSQLACSCKRLPAADAVPILRELLKRAEDVRDPHIPLLLWWAIEAKAISDRKLVLSLLDTPASWAEPLVRQTIVERLARRYLAEGTEAGLATCARLLEAAPTVADSDRLVRGMEKALEGRCLATIPPVLQADLDRLEKEQGDKLDVLRLAVRLGSQPAYDRALERLADVKSPERERSSLMEVVGQAGKPECIPVLLRVLGEAKSNQLRGAALAALEAFPDPRIAPAVLTLYPRLPGDLRARAQALLCSRPASALLFLQRVDTGAIDARQVPLDQLQRLAHFHKPDIDRLLEKHWGKVGQATAGEKQTRIRNVLSALSGKGNPRAGKEVFQKTCATCHTLFGEGGKVGPELTGADRKNRTWMVTNIVDPSALIRAEFTAFTINMTDGRVLTGLVSEATPRTVTLVNAKAEKTVLARDQIETMQASPISLMPEKLLDPLEDQQLRDLFSYLESEPPSK